MKLVISAFCILLLVSCGEYDEDSKSPESQKSKTTIRNIVSFDGWRLRCETTEFADGINPLREYWYSDKNTNHCIINTRQAGLTQFFMLSDSLLLFRTTSSDSHGQKNLYVFNIRNHQLKALGNLELPQGEISDCLNFKKQCVYTIDPATNSMVACNWHNGGRVVLAKLPGGSSDFEQKLYQRNDTVIIHSFQRKNDTLTFCNETLVAN